MKSLEEYSNGYIGYKREVPYTLIANLTQRLNGMVENMPDSITKVKDFRVAIEKIEEESQGIHIDLSTDELSSIIAADMEEAKNEYSDKLVDELDSLLNEIDAKRNEIQEQNKIHNASLRNGDVEANADWDVIEQKKQSLMEYSDTVFDLCSMYGISTTGVYVPDSVKNPKDLGELYDGYAIYLEKEENKRNPVVWFRNKVPNVQYQGIVLLILFLLSFTPLLVVGSIALFTYFVSNQSRNRNRVNYYSLLAALLYNCDLSEMKVSTYSEADLLPEVIADDDLENYEEFTELLSKIQSKQEELNEVEENGPKTEVDMSAYNGFLSNIDSIREDFKYEEDVVRDEVDNISIRLRQIKDLLDKSEQAFIEQWKELGQDYNFSAVYKTTYKLGLNNYEYQEVDYGLNNLIIRPSADEESTKYFVRTLFFNAFCNVQPELISATIFDPNSLGQSLMAFYADDPFKLLIDFKKDDLASILKDLRAYVDEGMKLMQGRDIQAYNKECDEVGKIPRGYRLLIILSQSDVMEETEELQAFLSISAKYGVFIWVVSDSLNAPDTKVIRRIWKDVPNPLVDFATDAKCRNFKNEFKKAREISSKKGMNIDDFFQNVMQGKRWYKSASERIEFILGYKNGDPAEPTVFSVGNVGDIHALMVGGTGAGKSVCLNLLIGSLGLTYSPKEVELWLVDFKGSEFSYYLGTSEYPQRLPQMKACLCTSDGDYAASVFSHFDRLSQLRYSMLTTPSKYYPGEDIPGFKNMLQWNDYWDAMAEEAPDEETAKKYLDRKFKRIFLICDEFSVIFSKGSDEVKQIVTIAITSISKVARACGMHLLFGSQDMNKTVSASVLEQFSLRFALRLDAVSTSNEILGSPIAAQIREQNGYMYIRTSATKGTDLPKYRTPYIPDKDKPGKPSKLRQLILEAAQLAEEQNMPKHDVITYQEITEHQIEEIKTYYDNENFSKYFSDDGMFILGERMAYEENKLPDNVQIEHINNMHIYADFSVYNDLVLWFNTIMYNMNLWRTKPTVFINSQIADLAYITEAENYITDDRFKEIMTEKTSCETLVGWLEGIYNRRKETEKKDPFYFILMGWDKGTGLGINPDPSLKKRFEALLQQCAEFGMHMIMINTKTNMQFSSIVEACKIRIAGKCTNDESMTVIGNKRAGTNYEGVMQNGGYFFVSDNGRVTRDKLYKSEVKHQVKDIKLVIK